VGAARGRSWAAHRRRVSHRKRGYPELLRPAFLEALPAQSSTLVGRVGAGPGARSVPRAEAIKEASTGSVARLLKDTSTNGVADYNDSTYVFLASGPSLEKLESAL
jgi:hypothetical protein